MKPPRLKWAIVLGVAGATISALVLIAFHIWPGGLARQAISYVHFFTLDLCDHFSGLFFKGEYLAPPPKQSMIFEGCLAITAGIQWFIIGFLGAWLARGLRKKV